MTLLTVAEKSFLDVFLHEATTAPFTGPATRALHAIGVEYADISHVAWAYEQEVARTGFTVGRAADVAPSLPWPDRQSALGRTQEIRQAWEHRRQGVGGPAGPSTRARTRDGGDVPVERTAPAEQRHE